MKRLAGLALCTVMMIAAAGGVLVFGDDNETQYAFNSAAEEKALEIVNARMNGANLS